jgi:hypothetical protein
MSKCTHRRIHFEHREDKYGQNILCRCSCGTVKTNWHTEEWKARQAYFQVWNDMLGQGKIEFWV